ncbi:Uncharacterised protein [Achromobacter ruhlandii]|nr:Uncharacterised protein [Achromobacter ruhlandii]CUJ50890.1 Uncharacterised protein [Achromobacter ruhlandii]CUK08670.1 Uncharacterised protein [Achromobacter ruhlandii]
MHFGKKMPEFVSSRKVVADLAANRVLECPASLPGPRHAGRGMLALVLCGAALAPVVGLAANPTRPPDLPAPQADHKGALERAFATFLRGAAKADQARRDARSQPLLAAAAPAHASSTPNLTMPLGDGSLSLGRDSFALSTPDSRFRVGAGAMDSAPIGRIEYATLITDRFALGASMQLGEYQRELIGRGLFVDASKQYEFDAALSLMKGRPSFDFDSGSARVPVTQLAGVVSARRLFSPESGLGLHALGVSGWAARAHSPNNLSSRTVTEDYATYTRLLYDPRRIATGRLYGASVDLQYAPFSTLVLRTSLGMESERYPMGNGTVESRHRPYLSGGLKFALYEDYLLDLQVSNGVSRDLVASLSGDKARLSFGMSRGRDGALNSKTVMVYVDLMKFISPSRHAADDTSLALRESLQQYAGARLLDKAVTRPDRIPQTFLAKVDRTGVQEVFIEKAGLPPGAKLSADSRSLNVAVGSGALTLVSVQKNGAALSAAPQFTVSPGQVNVALMQLPVPAAIDEYVVRVTDAALATYNVTITVGSK